MRRLATMLGVAGLGIAIMTVAAGTGRGGVFDHLFKHDPNRPYTMVEIAKMIDCVEDKIRDDGTIVVKRPDVWGQARMSKYRMDFENAIKPEMKYGQDDFHQTLQAVLARSDVAQFQSQTALSAVLTPTTRTNGRRNPIEIAPDAVGTKATEINNNLFTATGLLGGSDPAKPTTAVPPAPLSDAGTSFPLAGKLNGVFVGTQTAADGKTAASPVAVGLEPTEVIQQHKRYLDHLNEARRVNMGDDNADSAGNQLYLIRMPASVQPGEVTLKGHGAQLTVTAHHDFAPDYLANTFRTLVINDIVDQLGPVIYELIREGEGDYRTILKNATTANLNLAALEDKFEEINGKLETQKQNMVEASIYHAKENPNSLKQLTRREMLAKQEIDVNKIQSLVGNLNKDKEHISNSDEQQLRSFTEAAVNHYISPESGGARSSFVAESIDSFISNPKNAGTKSDALSEAVQNKLAQQENLKQRDKLARDMKKAQEIATSASRRIARATGANIPLTRMVERSYPIAPSDLTNVFLTENLLLLASDTQRALMTETPRATDVRAFLRHQLQTAYDMMLKRARDAKIVLDDSVYIEDVVRLISARNFRLSDASETDEILPEDRLVEGTTPQTSLTQAYRNLIARLPFRVKLPDDLNEDPEVVELFKEQERDGGLGPLGPLCWAIAVDAGLLNRELRRDVARNSGKAGFSCPDDLENVYFYTPLPHKSVPDMRYPEAARIFEGYVRAKWPIVTFALDPVTDEQNIGDAFSRVRDLQLALAMGFAAGRINFQQLNRFRRQLNEESATIGLNRTVTAFAHGNETFGWRISPRFQTPPQERNNVRVITNQLVRGGPGRNYQIRNSKLEAGQRELTAVLIMPSILQSAKFEFSGNWYPLHDPDQIKPHTARQLELGRQVVELRQAVATTCNSGQYREDDLTRLMTKVDQLEAMLPLQTHAVKIPYGNMLSGFELFTPGTSALAPEIIGFQGVDSVNQDSTTSILLYGKNFSLNETKIVAGGQPLAPDTAVELLSREVARITLPANMNPSQIKTGTDNNDDGKSESYVEVYLATPNGISNRMLIPYDPPKKEAEEPSDGPISQKPDVEAAYSLADDSLTINGIVQKVGTETRISRVEFKNQEQIRILRLKHDKIPTSIKLTMTFNVAGSQNLTTSIDEIPYDRQKHCFLIKCDKLNALAGDVFDKLLDNGVIKADGSFTKQLASQTVRIDVTEPDDVSATTNQLKINVGLYLNKAVAAATKTAAADDTAKKDDTTKKDAVEDSALKSDDSTDRPAIARSRSRTTPLAVSGPQSDLRVPASRSTALPPLPSNPVKRPAPAVDRAVQPASATAPARKGVVERLRARVK